MKKGEDWLFQDSLSFKSIIMGVARHSSQAIFGPMLMFIGLGFILDSKFGTKPIWMIVGLAISFFVTNILLAVKTMEFMKVEQKIAIKKEKSKK